MAVKVLISFRVKVYILRLELLEVFHELAVIIILDSMTKLPVHRHIYIISHLSSQVTFCPGGKIHKILYFFSHCLIFSPNKSEIAIK